MNHYTLGVFYLFHDSSACLLKDGVIVAMAEEERFNRKKHSFELPEHAIRYCLDQAGISFADVDEIAYGFRPIKYLFNQILSSVLTLPRSLNLFRPGASYMPLKRKVLGMFRIKRDLVRIFGPTKACVHYVDHHTAHAYSTFVPSGFQDAAIFIADGFGEDTATSFFVGNTNGIQKIQSVPLPESLGVYYAAVTQFLGFRPHGDEYKVMGMAAYGQNTYVQKFAKILGPQKDKLGFWLDLSFIDFYTHGLRQWYSKKFCGLLGTPRAREDQYEQRHYDIARSAQTQLEETAIAMLKRFRQVAGKSKLCLAGGVAQNVLMNRRILDECGFDEVFVPPTAYDGGISLGAALAVYSSVVQKGAITIRPKLENAGLGPEFSDADCLDALQKSGLKSVDLGDKYDQILDQLEAGKVIGVFDGRLEIGPRALGRRSIIADPRHRSMVDTLNARIKRREFFRPFAPAVPQEECQKFFDLPGESLFMTTVAKVKAPQIVPAITHNDGTARVQTVTRASNQKFHRLLSEFGQRTGVPVLINTSFNENEPIVCRPQEAIDCFMRTHMDALVFNYRYLVVK